ncbi:hypothetical protein AVEN_14750-1 [Araneus ventricosus]|uniref:Uncharacterized protein n=1 Tax=Araneus ventricosus TaxID=182803 RepID=A0A4Y2NH20_ARAVE|nr:hypothetical protein AVEN_14750-1 [Araneus ventricosus]
MQLSLPQLLSLFGKRGSVSSPNCLRWHLFGGVCWSHQLQIRRPHYAGTFRFRAKAIGSAMECPTMWHAAICARLLSLLEEGSDMVASFAVALDSWRNLLGHLVYETTAKSSGFG